MTDDRRFTLAVNKCFFPFYHFYRLLCRQTLISHDDDADIDYGDDDDCWCL